MAVVMAALAGCGVPTDDAPRGVSTDELPAELTAQEPTTTTAAVGRPVEIWLVREGRLAAVPRTVAVPVTGRRLLEVLLAAPATDEANAGFRTALAPDDVVRSVTIASGVATVDLDETFSAAPSSEQALALGQLVFTFTGLPDVQAVAFTLEGQPAEIPAGDGSLRVGPVRRSDFAGLA